MHATRLQPPTYLHWPPFSPKNSATLPDRLFCSHCWGTDAAITSWSKHNSKALHSPLSQVLSPTPTSQKKRHATLLKAHFYHVLSPQPPDIHPSCHPPDRPKKSGTSLCMKHTFNTYSPLSLLTSIRPVTHLTNQRKASHHPACQCCSQSVRTVCCAWASGSAWWWTRPFSSRPRMRFLRALQPAQKSSMVSFDKEGNKLDWWMISFSLRPSWRITPSTLVPNTLLQWRQNLVICAAEHVAFMRSTHPGSQAHDETGRGPHWC